MALVKYLQCYKCKKKFSPQRIIFECDKCGSSLDIIYDYEKIKEHIIKESFKRELINHWKYWPFYPIEKLDEIVTLNEGGTPLLHSKNTKGILFKLEITNPTASFKDRGSTVEISKAKELNVKEIICASTGNMGASIAAYASRAAINTTIYVPTFAPQAKFIQIASYGAKIIRVKGTYEDALNQTKELRKRKGVYLTGDYPYRGEGEKSVGFEIIDQLNWQPPNNIFCPIGNGTLIYGIYKSFIELKKVGLIKKIPKIIAVQASGCNPIIRAFKKHSKTFKPIPKPKTIAGAIACGNPVDGLKALHAIYDSKGSAVDVTDREIIKAKKELGKEGIYAEPAGAVSFAGAKKTNPKGTSVCIITGHGLKDPKIHK